MLFIDEKEKKKLRNKQNKTTTIKKSKFKSKTSRNKRPADDETDETQEYYENKFVQKLPSYIPNDHPVQIGYTITYDSYYFVVLINNSRKSIILKIVNPRVDPYFFHFKLEVKNLETTITFCHEDFKFNVDYQERQIFLDPEKLKKLIQDIYYLLKFQRKKQDQNNKTLLFLF